MKKHIPIICLMVLFCMLVSNITQGQATEEWTALYNGSGDNTDQAQDIALDAFGNIYVTGWSRNSEGFYDYATVKYDTDGNRQWVAHYDGPGHRDDQAYAVVIDAAGNVYVTGNSDGDEGLPDYATVKYDPEGNQQWVALYSSPGTSSDYAWDIALDAFGYIYVTGSGGDSGDSRDYITVKYDPEGNQQWVSYYDGPANTIDQAFSIAIDAANNAYITGSSQGGTSDYDYATVKYDTDGNQQWIARYNSSSDSTDQARDIAVDAAGNVYVTGRSLSTDSFYDYATVKYDTDGNQQWVSRYSAPGYQVEYAWDIALDQAGNVYVTGLSRSADNGFDYATVKYDPDGTQQWVARYDGPYNANDQARAIALDTFGNVYVTGSSQSISSSDDYATVKYDSDGNQQWVNRYNGPGNQDDHANAIAVDNQGSVYVTGWSTGDNNNYDYATIKYSQTMLLPDFTASDVCLGEATQFLDNSTGTSSNTQYSWDFDGDGLTDDTTAGDVSYTYSEAGTYQATLTLTEGAEASQKNVTVTVFPLPLVDLGADQQLCPGSTATLDAGPGYSYQWSTGETSQEIVVSESGNYSVITTSSNGCQGSDDVTITFADTEPPVLSAVDFTTYTAPGSCESTLTEENFISLAQLSLSDNCDTKVRPLFSNGENGDEITFPFSFTDGILVFVNAVDSSGNNAPEQSLTITVLDTVPPTITAPPDTLVTTDPGSCHATITLSNPITDDNCTVVSVTNDAPTAFPAGITTVTWIVTDQSGNKSQVFQIVEVTNEVPIIDAIHTPSDPILANTEISVNASVNDNNLVSATWYWGDGTNDPGIINGNLINGSHRYTSPGLYALTLEVTDACGAISSYTYEKFIIIYEYKGFVIGGGWINSPVGAYVDNPSLQGKISFGFVAKYKNFFLKRKKTPDAPIGSTVLVFKTANIVFRSTSYEWLVIDGNTAKFKGEGKVNGKGRYGFMLSAVDGHMRGGDRLDRLRIKIWDKQAGNLIVYDNQMGASDDAEVLPSIAQGSIIIHPAKVKHARYEETIAKSSFSSSLDENITIESDFQWQVFPNPLQKHLFINIDSPINEEATVRIYDMTGRLLLERKENLEIGNNQIVIPEVEKWIGSTNQILLRLQTPSQGIQQTILLKP
uniref:SBBP repeat-containing protein n=1 Tax=Roseihalotalea indica TaxID=2867963 RepID=A0AA49GND2_9BACT|nr:SBBP repeat-containing protein [Tunicatimonas sp. TK19036]